MNIQNYTSLLLGRLKALTGKAFTTRHMQLALVTATVTLCSSNILLTSCHDDNLNSSVTKEEADSVEYVRQLVGVHFDMSDVAMSGKGDNYGTVGIWDIQPDLSFSYYCIQTDSAADSLMIDTLRGTVKPFYNQTYTLCTNEQIKTDGFTATFDHNSHDALISDVTMNYYDINTATDSMTFVSEDCLDYGFMGIYDGTTSRSTASNFLDELKKELLAPIVGLSNALDILKKLARTRALSDSECEKYWKASNTTIDSLKKAVGFKDQDFSNWMGTIYKDKDPRICDMNIPGSHDAFTCGLIDDNVWHALKAHWACCQTNDIKTQWKSGVRYFDVRCKKDGRIYHGVDCNYTVNQAITDIENLLKDHPTETAIMVFQIDGTEGADEYKAIHDIAIQHKSKFVQNPTGGMKLSDCKGKIIVFQAWDEANKYSTYRFAPTFCSPYMHYKTVNLYFYKEDGKYDTTKCLYQNICEYFFNKGFENYWDEKQARMLDCFNDTKKTKGSTEPIWAVNPPSGYVGYKVAMSYAKNANVMNPWTFSYVINHRTEKLGIIPMDYAGSNAARDFVHVNGANLAEAVVLTNKFQ